MSRTQDCTEATQQVPVSAMCMLCKLMCIMLAMTAAFQSEELTAATAGPPMVSRAVSSGKLPFLAAMCTAVCPYRLAWRTRAPTALPAALSSLTAILCLSATAAAIKGVQPSPYNCPSWQSYTLVQPLSGECVCAINTAHQCLQEQVCSWKKVMSSLKTHYNMQFPVVVHTTVLSQHHLHVCLIRFSLYAKTEPIEASNRQSDLMIRMWKGSVTCTTPSMSMTSRTGKNRV